MMWTEEDDEDHCDGDDDHNDVDDENEKFPERRRIRTVSQLEWNRILRFSFLIVIFLIALFFIDFVIANDFLQPLQRGRRVIAARDINRGEVIFIIVMTIIIFMMVTYILKVGDRGDPVSAKIGGKKTDSANLSTFRMYVCIMDCAHVS